MPRRPSLPGPVGGVRVFHDPSARPTGLTLRLTCPMWSYDRDMRAKPIGTKRPTTNARDVPRRRPLRPEAATASGTADLYPVDVRTNAGPRNGRVDRFARLIITDDALYVASSLNKGKDIESVVKYPLPPGERVQSAAKKGSWGPFTWSGCGCGNSWGMHTRSKLVKIGNGTGSDA